MRNKMVTMAKSWLGCNEADGSHKKIVDTYNSIKPLPVSYKLSYNDAWCAAFVSAVAWKAGCINIVFPECSCDRMIALYKKAGRWQENDAYTPKIADIIFYDWQDSGSGNNTGSSDHVGIVTAVNGNTITVIEGNMSDKVGYRKLSINGRYIRGYGCPDYEGNGIVSNTTTPNTTVLNVAKPAVIPTTETVTIKVRKLSKGAIGDDVEALQLLLVGRGCSVGIDGADGDFGKNTLSAVKKFQSKKNLTADGVVGSKTWDALINN